MADTKISALPASTTPLAGTEVLPIVQSSTTKQVSVANLTAGRTVNATALGVGVTTPAAGTTIEARNAAAGTAIRASNSGGGFVEIACESNATSNAQLNYTNQITAAGGNFVLSGANFVVSNGNGIDFSATPGTGTSELLADYEEGTWTPTQGAGLVVVGAFSSSGTYTKIGRQVTVRGALTGATSIASLAGNVITAGLPFTPASPSNGAASNAFAGSASVCLLSGNDIFSILAIANGGAVIYFAMTYFV
jgi:hypothetical protein